MYLSSRGWGWGEGGECEMYVERSLTPSGAIYSFADPLSPPHLYRVRGQLKTSGMTNSFQSHEIEGYLYISIPQSSWVMMDIRNPCAVLHRQPLTLVFLQKHSISLLSGNPSAIVSNLLASIRLQNIDTRIILCRYITYVLYNTWGEKKTLPPYTGILDSVPFENEKRVEKEKIDIIMHGYHFSCSGRQELTNLSLYWFTRSIAPPASDGGRERQGRKAMIRHGFELFRRTDDDCRPLIFFCLYQKWTSFTECHSVMQSRGNDCMKQHGCRDWRAALLSASAPPPARICRISSVVLPRVTLFLSIGPS